MALTIRTFVNKLMSLLFNMLSMFLIAFLPRNKCPLISRLQSLSAVILEHHQSDSSVAQSCPTLWDSMGCSSPGFPVHHQLLRPTQTHVHRISIAIQVSHPLLSPSPLTFNLSQHQGLFQWVGSSHQVAKILQFQLQDRSFQWKFRNDFL